MPPSLNGRVVAFVEARMLSEMAALVERHGGVAYPAPVLQEVYLNDDPDVQRLIRDVCDDRIDVVVLLTGVGTRALIESADAMGLKQRFLDYLNTCTIYARSPKPARVLRQHNIHIDLMPPEPYTSQDLVNAIGNTALEGKEVAVQAYGGPNNFLTRSLREKGANVREVKLYSWGIPEDKAPVLRMIDDLAAGKIDAVAFTSQPQVDNLLAIADQSDRGELLRNVLARDSLTIASIGPVCSRKLRERNIRVDVEPAHVHMGNLIIALADRFQAEAATTG